MLLIHLRKTGTIPNKLIEVIMEIKRNKYLQMLQIRRNNGFVKVITGIRRSGKSYLINEIFYDALITEDVEIQEKT